MIKYIIATIAAIIAFMAALIKFAIMICKSQDDPNYERYYE